MTMKLNEQSIYEADYLRVSMLLRNKGPFLHKAARVSQLAIRGNQLRLIA